MNLGPFTNTSSVCNRGYLRRIHRGDGMPSGYAVQKSKKWKRNQQSNALIDEVDDLADNREPSQESANPPRGNTVDPRGNLLYPRGNPLPIRKTLQDNTEQTTAEAVDGDENQTTKTKNPADEIDRVYQAYLLKKAPATAITFTSTGTDVINYILIGPNGPRGIVRRGTVPKEEEHDQR